MEKIKTRYKIDDRSGQVILYFVEKYPAVFHDGSSSHTRPDG